MIQFIVPPLALNPHVISVGEKQRERERQRQTDRQTDREGRGVERERGGGERVTARA